MELNAKNNSTSVDEQNKPPSLGGVGEIDGEPSVESLRPLEFRVWKSSASFENITKIY